MSPAGVFLGGALQQSPPLRRPSSMVGQFSLEVNWKDEPAVRRRALLPSSKPAEMRAFYSGTDSSTAVCAFLASASSAITSVDWPLDYESGCGYRHLSAVVECPPRRGHCGGDSDGLLRLFFSIFSRQGLVAHTERTRGTASRMGHPHDCDCVRCRDDTADYR